MKKIIVPAILLLLTGLSACKKENHKPAVTTPPASTTPTQPTKTIAQSLAGKWVVVKDSIQAFDYNAPMSFNTGLSFNNADNVTFNEDGTGVISSMVAYDALYTDYVKLYINSQASEIPNLNFDYLVSAKDSTLSIPMINSINGIGYSIKTLSPNSLVLYTQNSVEKYPHNYSFKQYIYFSR